jgi:hypothetical protein
MKNESRKTLEQILKIDKSRKKIAEENNQDNFQKIL